MRKIIILFIVIFLFGAGAAYAGQEDKCSHDSYTITYSSDKGKAKIYCNDCGESHDLKIDSFFVEKVFKNIWEE